MISGGQHDQIWKAGPEAAGIARRQWTVSKRGVRANEEIGQHLRLAAAAPPVLQEGLAGEEESRFREPLPGAFPAPRRSFLQDFVLGLPDRAVTGGPAYDALVAATAAASGAEVFTCDRRAAAIYDRYGVRTRFLA